MNAVSRGVRSALRSPLRSGAIILMLAISIGLILAMLVARTSVNNEISEVKASTASNITVAPAGFRGGMGGGDALTADQVTTISKTAHVSGVVSTLTDQLGSSDTNLTPSLELGNLGKRIQRFESSGGGGAVIIGGGPEDSSRPAPTPRTAVTGTTDPNSVSSNGSTLTLSSGTTINATSGDLTALVGTTLATKNNLSVGSTFTAYGQTITVKGIYKTGNTFQDSGIIMPLATVQNLTSQAGAVTNVTVHVDSSENVKSVVSALTSSLGSKADVTSEADRVAESLAPLESIASLALGGVIAATAAGAAIVLLAMIMIVRERKREIGVIKAIGGTNGKVITQFITEAMTMTIVAAIIGLAIGVAVSGPMTQSLVQNQSPQSSQLPRGNGSQGFRRAGAFFQGGFNQAGASLRQVSSTLTPQVFGLSIGITLLIAIIGSAVPAWLIARVRPAEVLRTE
jgi:putative ABC transport system permease protein